MDVLAQLTLTGQFVSDESAQRRKVIHHVKLVQDTDRPLRRSFPHRVR